MSKGVADECDEEDQCKEVDGGGESGPSDADCWDDGEEPDAGEDPRECVARGGGTAEGEVDDDGSEEEDESIANVNGGAAGAGPLHGASDVSRGAMGSWALCGDDYWRVAWLECLCVPRDDCLDDECEPPEEEEDENSDPAGLVQVSTDYCHLADHLRGSN